MFSRTTSPGHSSINSWMVTKLPSDFDIFSPSTCKKPLCIQKFAIALVWKAQRDCAISFSWCGKTRSMPPPWMSKVSPSSAADIAEHSMCQPGRPRPHGLSQPGKSGGDRFHFVERAFRQSAVIGHARDGEQHMTFRHVGIAIGNQPLDQADHVDAGGGLVDVFGGARLDGRLQAAERRHVGLEIPVGLLRQLTNGDAALRR